MTKEADKKNQSCNKYLHNSSDTGFRHFTGLHEICLSTILNPKKCMRNISKVLKIWIASNWAHSDMLL